LFEQAKNTAISHKILYERSHDVAAVDRMKTDVIFDFIVKDMSHININGVTGEAGK
jgi:hypothetical protein